MFAVQHFGQSRAVLISMNLDLMASTLMIPQLKPEHFQVKRTVAHLSEQGPGVLAQVRADRSQQQGLVLNKLEHQVSVHSLDGQLPVFILSCLGGEIIEYKFKLYIYIYI